MRYTKKLMITKRLRPQHLKVPSVIGNSTSPVVGNDVGFDKLPGITERANAISVVPLLEQKSAELVDEGPEVTKLVLFKPTQASVLGYGCIRLTTR